jgi:excisionase family DNA binding protein
VRDDGARSFTRLARQADAAKCLGLRAPTLHRSIDEGRLPAYRMGRVIPIKVSEIDWYIAA